MKGKLIVIEGTDGSGKATQSKLLVEKLKQQKNDVEYVEFPQYGTPGAAMVEQYLNGKFGTAEEVGPYRASIFYAIDRYAKSKDIQQWLDQGKIVICNRYTSANKGHQAGKLKDDDKIDGFLDWLDDLEFNLFKIPKPDKIFLLYMPCEIGQKLVDKKGHRDYVGGEKKDIHEADINHLKDAEAAYMYVAKKEGWEIISCYDGDDPLPIEEIHNLILNSVSGFI
ncbi:thymidylate kinase [Candidatus Woesearchaeota archaeon]|nr:thymidylate kinase [Candidatus Woesearchaeota archaeon]